VAVKIDNKIKQTILIILCIFPVFYLFRVWKTYTFTGEWHYNLFSYYGLGTVAIVVVIVIIAIVIGKMKL
jgi:hypothetical protein